MIFEEIISCSALHWHCDISEKLEVSIGLLFWHSRVEAAGGVTLWLFALTTERNGLRTTPNILAYLYFSHGFWKNSTFSSDRICLYPFIRMYITFDGLQLETPPHFLAFTITLWLHTTRNRQRRYCWLRGRGSFEILKRRPSIDRQATTTFPLKASISENYSNVRFIFSKDTKSNIFASTKPWKSLAITTETIASLASVACFRSMQTLFWTTWVLQIYLLRTAVGHAADV